MKKIALSCLFAIAAAACAHKPAADTPEQVVTQVETVAETPTEAPDIASDDSAADLAGESVDQPESMADLCKASQYADKIGQSLEDIAFPSGANIRVIYPGSMVTRDYRPDRLNINVTDDHVITGFHCG